MTITEVFAEENRVVEREATAEEIKQKEETAAYFEQLAQAKLEATAARQAVLDRLGITAEEAQLIIGGSN
jgi:hypothetical protein